MNRYRSLIILLFCASGMAFAEEPSIVDSSGGGASTEKEILQYWNAELPLQRFTQAMVSDRKQDGKDAIAFTAQLVEQGQIVRISRRIQRSWVHHPQLNANYWQCDNLGDYRMEIVKPYEKMENFDPLLFVHRQVAPEQQPLIGTHLSGSYVADNYEAIVVKPTPASMSVVPTMQDAFPRDYSNKMLENVVIYPVVVRPYYPFQNVEMSFGSVPPLPVEYCYITDNLPIDASGAGRTAHRIEQHMKDVLTALFQQYKPAVLQQGDSVITYFADWSKLQPFMDKSNPGMQLMTFSVVDSFSEYAVADAHIEFAGLEKYLLNPSELRRMFMLGIYDQRIQDSFAERLDLLMSSVENRDIADGKSFSAPLRVVLKLGPKKFTVKGKQPNYVAKSWNMELQGTERESILYLDRIGEVQRVVTKDNSPAKIQAR